MFVGLFLAGLFTLWGGIQKSKTETQVEIKEETQVSESNDCDCSNID